MPGLVKRTVRTTQPQTAVGIDWGNPVTRGLNAYFNASNSTYEYPRFATYRGVFGYFANISIELGQGIASKVTPNRTLLVINTGKGNAATFPVATSIGTGSGDSGRIIAIGMTNSGFIRYYGGSGSSSHIIAGSSMPSSTSVMVARKTSEGTLTGWLNGKLDAEGAGGVTTINTPTSFCIGGAVDANRWTSSLSLVIQWNRALLDTEIAYISANPWQIFQPDVSYLDAIYQERLTISPDESRWMGSRGRSMEVSEVVQKHVSVRTSQPQGPVEIDWGNPISRSLADAIISTNLNSALGRECLYKSEVYPKVVDKEVFSTIRAFSNTGTVNQQYPNDSGPSKIPYTVYVKAYVGISAGLNVGIVSTYVNNTYGWLIAFIGQRVVAQVSRGGGTVSIQSTEEYPLNTPVSIVLKVTPTLLSMYINGKLVSDAAHSSPQLSTTDSLRFFGGNLTYSNISGFSAYSAWNRDLSDTEIKSISANPWQLFKPQQKTLVYERQVPKIDPPVPKVKAMKLIKHTRTQQPTNRFQYMGTGSLNKGLQLLYTGSGYNRAFTGQTLGNAGGQVFKYDSNGRYYNTHGNPAAATSISLGSSTPYTLETTYFYEVMETQAQTGHFIGNCAPNYSINTGLSLLRGSQLSAVMCTSGGVVTTATSPNLSLYNKWRRLAVRIRFNGTNYTLSLFEEGTLVAENAGGYTKPNTGANIIICGNSADFYTGTTYANILTIATWGRALSDAEIKNISDNPWQIFQPESKTVWVDA